MLYLLPLPTTYSGEDATHTGQSQKEKIEIFIFLFIFFVFLLFLGPLPRHMEVPRLGVQSELAMPEPQ